MKIAVIIVRVLIGLLLIFSSVVVLFDLIPQPELEGDLALFTEGLAASGYLLPLVKIIELVCGIAFLSGLFVPLATVVFFPIAVNILLVHLYLDRAGLPVALMLFLGILFLAFACRRHYGLLLAPRIRQT